MLFLRSLRYCRGLDRWWASDHHPQEPSCQAGWAHDLWSAASWPCSQSHPHCFWSASDPRFWVWTYPARVPWMWETDARCPRSYQKAAEQMSGTSEWRRRDGESRLAHCTYLFHILEPCVCVHTREKCIRMTCSIDCTREMCVRQEACRHPVAHTVVTTTWVRNTP